MAIPKRIKNPQLSDYLEVMSRAIFQAGLRWSLIEKKWPAFLELFGNFDVSYVASLSSGDVVQLAADERILRSPKKIEATVQNAKTILALDKQFGSFKQYLQSFQNYDDLAADIKKRFQFMGDLNVYYFLFRVNEDVPPFEEWITTVSGDHPRIKEMVEDASTRN